LEQFAINLALLKINKKWNRPRLGRFRLPASQLIHAELEKHPSRLSLNSQDVLNAVKRTIIKHHHGRCSRSNYEEQISVHAVVSTSTTPDNQAYWKIILVDEV